jgi:hypothetical protein
MFIMGKQITHQLQLPYAIIFSRGWIVVDLIHHSVLGSTQCYIFGSVKLTQRHIIPVKKSTKAVLLSALAFPGAGHLYLKAYLSGFLLVSVTFSIILYIVKKATDQAYAIVEEIQNGGAQLDIAGISELVSKGSSGTDMQLQNAATLVLIVCWIVGIADSYRRARKTNPDGEEYVKEKT